MDTVDGRRCGIAIVATAIVATALAVFGVAATGTAEPGGASAMADAAGTQGAGVTDSGPRWPRSIVGRKVLDQDGDVYLIRTFSSWGMASNLSDAGITSALEEVAANGFNGVTVWLGGGAYYGEDWSPTYQQKATGQAFWDGTPWASGLGLAWASMDHLVAEAQRLGIVVWMSLNSGLGVPRADFQSVTNDDMYSAGAAIAARYRSAPNLGWHVMIDDKTVTTDGPVGQRIDAFFRGVNDAEGASTRPVRWLEVGGGNSTNEQGWLGTTSFDATINAWYEFGGNSTEIAQAGYAEVPTVPVGDAEPPYDGSPHYGGDPGQQLRERSYATFLDGGSLINYGHEDWWRFGLTGLYSEGLTWQEVQGHSHTVQQAYVWRLLDQYVADRSWAPDGGSFVTTGVGSGDTKAAAGQSDAAAIAYFPSARDVVVDTTVIAGSNPVRLRWYDPTAGTYTTVAASEEPQTDRSVPYPPAHPDGSSDWVLVVDAAGGTTPTSSPESSTTEIGSTTTPAESSTTSEAESTTSEAESTTTEAQSSTTEAESTTTEAESTTTEAESTTTEAQSTTVPPTTVGPTARVPTAPRWLKATGAAGAVQLTWLPPRWNGGAAITDYVVQRSVDRGQTWGTVDDGVSLTPATTVGGLNSGQRYWFRVAAVNGAGRGAWSAAASAVTATVPTAPVWVIPLRARGAVRLTWLPPRWNGGAAVTDYVVQRSVNRGGTWRTVDDGVSLTRTTTVGGLSSGQRYWFRVAALNAVGRGPWSAAASTVLPASRWFLVPR